ncbi:MAG: putative ABC transport system permease protein [Rickettsiales bacterium]|jgi:putative ABC transport system permease protein
MNLLTISLSYLTSRLQNSILNVVMMAAGIMLITILVLFGSQVQQRLTADSKGIDGVIGAKGSPLQLVLSSVYHIDIPTGNINLKDANKIKKHPQIKRAIPISLGDSYKGFRIVGTNSSYIKHFQGSFSKGSFWQNSMEAVIGSEVAKTANLKLKDRFSGSHGLAQGGKIHDDETYKIVGILKPSKTVLDRLIITSLESVWDIHNHHEDEGHKVHDHHDKDKIEENKEITALLIKYKNKMAAMTFPRYVNKNTNMQAASPSFEIARLIKLIGIGKDGIILFGAFLIILSLSSMLIGLLNLVHQRRYDLAIFRTLGASRKKIFLMVIIEGMIISIIGSLIGLFAGHLAMEIIGNFSAKGSQLGLTGFIFLPQIFILWAGILFLCLVTCLIPAIRAYKTDIKEMLTHVS